MAGNSQQVLHLNRLFDKIYDRTEKYELVTTINDKEQGLIYNVLTFKIGYILYINTNYKYTVVKRHHSVAVYTWKLMGN